MDDQPSPTSGSRWEQDSSNPESSQPPPIHANLRDPAAPLDSEWAEPPGRGSRFSKGRLAMAGGALGLILAAGAGGLAAGHAIAGPDDLSRVGFTDDGSGGHGPDGRSGDDGGRGGDGGDHDSHGEDSDSATPGGTLT